jgi:hypothetical protein
MPRVEKNSSKRKGIRRWIRAVALRALQSMRNCLITPVEVSVALSLNCVALDY